MANNRIFYGTHQVGIRQDGQATYRNSFGEIVRGVQSVGMTTSFNLDQVFQLGQVELYENIEDIPDVEITLNKVLDGHPLVYCLATQDASTPTLSGRSTSECIFGLAVFDDTATEATGVPGSFVECSGMRISSMSYTFPVDGSFTEDVTLVGNDKLWAFSTDIINNPTDEARVSAIESNGFLGDFASGNSPIGSGTVNRRENLVFKWDGDVVDTDSNGAIDDSEVTVLPSSIFGIANNGLNVSASGIEKPLLAHITNISVSADLGRTDLNELGRKAPYFRTVDFPVEVTTEIETISISGDMVSATENGVMATVNNNCAAGGNLNNETIRIVTCEGTYLYMGRKNKLASTNYTGGDAGGGNVTVSQTYTTFSDFTIMHTGDPNTNFDSNALAIRQTYLQED